MPPPDLTSLPPWAAIAFGISLAIIWFVTRSGLAQGQRAIPATSSGAAQVAAVIVDPTALNRLTDQAVKLNEALEKTVEVGERMSRAQLHMATELDRIREELRIQRELGRRDR